VCLKFSGLSSTTLSLKLLASSCLFYLLLARSCTAVEYTTTSLPYSNAVQLFLTFNSCLSIGDQILITQTFVFLSTAGRKNWQL
jgi:hypothetical protein